VVVSGVGTLLVVASGLILGALIMHYLLKDGTRLRAFGRGSGRPGLRREVDGFIGDSCRVLRDYGRGRTVMTALGGDAVSRLRARGFFQRVAERAALTVRHVLR
jgi:predicted PurR-regulated permease PerM